MMEKVRRAEPRPARGETADAGRIGDPLDFIAEDHMREREVCALIDRLVALVPISPADRDRVLVFLQEQLPHHLEDEEIDLFPMMLERCEPEEEIDKVIDRLTSDHGHAQADAPAIVALIQTEAAELNGDARARLADFARHSRRHLVLENAIILPIARARLTPDDLRIMKRHMQERRGIAASGETQAP
jgi:hemerythrin-like domain-containing protein